MKTKSSRQALWIVSTFILGAWISHSEPLLKAGDRLVFLGDSITEQRIYTRYVMNYFTLRYPGAAISFRNAGWSGDTSPGGLSRLQRDILSLKPTAVSICFGMNDGGYTGFDQARYDRYITGMTGLVSCIRQAGVKVVLLTPGCVDLDKRPMGTNYNETLARYAAGVKDIAAREQLPSFDIHTLMIDVQSRAKADDPKFTMIPDSVHPSPPGQAVMAYGLLKALGCTNTASSLEVYVDKNAYGGDRSGAKDLKITDSSVTFVRFDAALPVYIDADPVIFKYLPFQEEMNAYRLKVTGLKPGSWKLTVQNIEVGTFTDTDLAKGINLATLPGPWLELGKRVNALSTEQEQMYYSRWRNISLAGIPKEAQAEQDALLKKLDELIDAKEAERIKAVADRGDWTWTLTRAAQ